MRHFETKEALLDAIREQLLCPATRVFEATVYFETVDKASNVHAITRTLRYERPAKEAA